MHTRPLLNTCSLFLPPVLAVKVIESEPRVCLSVCVHSPARTVAITLIFGMGVDLGLHLSTEQDDMYNHDK